RMTDMAIVREHEGALAEIVQQQAGEHDPEPGEHDGLAAEMAEVRIDRFRAGHGQEHASDDGKGDNRLMTEEAKHVERIDGEQDFGIVDDMAKPCKADGDEPDKRDRAED